MSDSYFRKPSVEISLFPFNQGRPQNNLIHELDFSKTNIIFDDKLVNRFFNFIKRSVSNFFVRDNNSGFLQISQTH